MHPFAGLRLDSGAAFIHDKRLRLYKEAKSRGLLARPGKTGLVVNRHYQPAWRFTLLHALPNLGNSKRLVTAFYRNQDPELTIEDLIAGQRFNPITGNFLRQILGSAFGVAVDQVAAKPLRDSFKAAGIKPERELINQALLVPLGELLSELYRPQAAQVHTHQQVNSVDYRQSEIEVSCTDGKLFRADRLVVTVPLGVLKKQSIHFTPPLPESHQTAIDLLGMGQGGRFFLRFSQRFWKPGLRQLINVDKPCHFWIPDDRQPVVSAFYIGREPGLDRILATLGQAFGRDARALLQEHHHEDWSGNPYIAGIYSYDAAGSEGARSMLQQPVSERLFFAGEAIIEGHFATVDGAIESGVRVAKQVMEQPPGGRNI